MALLEPEDGNSRAKWHKTTTLFQSVHVNVADALSNLKELNSLRLRLKDKGFSGGTATGRPSLKEG